MTKIQPVSRKLEGYNMTLAEEVHSLRRMNKESVRKLYGDIGVDIFVGRKPSILSQEDKKESKKLIYRIKAWWKGLGKLEYEENDRLRDVILKYTYNNKTGKTEEIRKLFGDKGVSELDIMYLMGYIKF